MGESYPDHWLRVRHARSAPELCLEFASGPYLCRYDGTSFRFYRDGGDDCGVFIVDLFLPCSKLLADVQSCRTAGGVVSGWAELR